MACEKVLAEKAIDLFCQHVIGVHSCTLFYHSLIDAQNARLFYIFESYLFCQMPV